MDLLIQAWASGAREAGQGAQSPARSRRGLFCSDGGGQDTPTDESRAGTGVEMWPRASSPQGDSGERRTLLHLALHLTLHSIPYYLQGRGDCSLLTQGETEARARPQPMMGEEDSTQTGRVPPQGPFSITKPNISSRWPRAVEAVQREESPPRPDASAAHRRPERGHWLRFQMKQEIPAAFCDLETLEPEPLPDSGSSRASGGVTQARSDPPRLARLLTRPDLRGPGPRHTCG